MDYSNEFEKLCQNIKIDNFEDIKISVGEVAKKLNKHYYNLETDSLSHIYIVGSVGRKTAIKGVSDIDVIFDLPKNTYEKYNDYETNGQSALLQDIKTVLKERYPRTKMKGDGQVVVIDFSKYSMEVVPAFKQNDGTFKYPDTHDGGSWKITNPTLEQTACLKCNVDSNEIYFDFCRLIRKWKNSSGVDFGGLLIDTLVYNHFLENDYYQKCSYEDYLDILLNFFKYLSKLDLNQKYWLAVGSKQYVYCSSSNFIKKSLVSYNKLNDAISKSFEIGGVLGEMLGTKLFNSSAGGVIKEHNSQPSHSNTEEFIEDVLQIDIQYSLLIDCTVSQDGWRNFSLLDYLKDKKYLRKNKKLNFFIKNTNCPKPYDIYWKILNVGDEARKRNCIRGQILKTNNPNQVEHTNFMGPHYVECYLVKNNICVARDRIDVPIEDRVE